MNQILVWTGIVRIRLETAINVHLEAGGAVIAATHIDMTRSAATIHLALGLAIIMRPFIAQISRDLDIAWQNRQDVVVMLGFFIIIIALFPLAIGPQSAMLAKPRHSDNLDCRLAFQPERI